MCDRLFGRLLVGLLVCLLCLRVGFACLRVRLCARVHACLCVCVIVGVLFACVSVCVFVCVL